MIKWMRPSGSTIETNETKASVEHAKSNKWKRVEGVKPVSTKAKEGKKIDNRIKDSQRFTQAL